MSRGSSWVEGTHDSAFGLDNLPYGLFSTVDAAPRLGARIGDHVLDLRAAADAGMLPPECAANSLNPLMAAGRERWSEVRSAIQSMLSDTSRQTRVEPMLAPLTAAELRLAFEVGDWVDFYASEQHAANVGKMFRPDAPPLLPNWRHMPVGYHGRSGTVVVSGTPIKRPAGQRHGDDGPVFGPSERLDIELELGFVVGPGTSLGEPVPIAHAGGHLFGVCVVNDWSARDIQAWEYQPLGPFLGKSFATSVSAWVTPLAALEPFRTEQPLQDPEPLPYLRSPGPWGFDIDLEIALTTAAMREAGSAPHLVATTNFRDMYWTADQQLAHLTANGASLRTGDLLGSGTVSGSGRRSYGSFLELSWNGTDPVPLPGGEVRTFLEDGDEVILTGRARRDGHLVGLGEVKGRIVA
jgi:fumarylacetoacetase